MFSNYAFWNQNFSLWQNYTRLWNDASDFINVFYKDRIFCTDETIDQKVDKYYDMNKGQFVTTTAYNNDYIVTS